MANTQIKSGAVKPPLSTLQPSASFGLSTNQAKLPLLSTHQDPRYFMISFMAVVDIGEDIDGGGPLYIDMLDSRIESFMNSLRPFATLMDDLSSPITTLTYRQYGNTSFWWLLLMYNSIIHPLERNAGTLRLPLGGAVAKVVNSANTRSLRGTTVNV